MGLVTGETFFFHLESCRQQTLGWTDARAGMGCCQNIIEEDHRPFLHAQSQVHRPGRSQCHLKVRVVLSSFSHACCQCVLKEEPICAAHNTLTQWPQNLNTCAVLHDMVHVLEHSRFCSRTLEVNSLASALQTILPALFPCGQ